MTKARLEAFSDGVIAILITIMVLELKTPPGGDFAALRPILPTLLMYLLSFIFLGIYWTNHHHMLHMTGHINGKILWANLHLLFWLSLIPFATRWMGEHRDDPLPTAVYGVLLLASAVAYTTLQQAIIADQGADSKLAAALGSDVKGRVSLLIYAASIPIAFVSRTLSWAAYVAVALLWLVPDRRIESRFGGRDS
jgi:uncharacterized membrane protein